MLKFIFTWWGNFRYSWNSSMFYIQAIQFGTILILGYDTSIYNRIYTLTGLHIALIPFLLILTIPFIFIMLFEHRYTTAATSRRGAELFYEQGPFKERFDSIEKKVDFLISKYKEEYCEKNTTKTWH